MLKSRTGFNAKHWFVSIDEGGYSINGLQGKIWFF
eukprot:UN12354